MEYKSGWERRGAEEDRATPGWADRKKIRAIYDFASKHCYHVDHIVPLNSPLVCGLHCEANLRVLHPNVNIRKGNLHWPDSWMEQQEIFDINLYGMIQPELSF